MGREIRLFGPPGTGKTTKLGQWVEQAAEKFGSEHIFVASFTKTAAVELVSRGLPIAKEQIGTLHAHCYRALGRGTIAETKIAEWNETHPGMPLGRTEVSLDDPTGEVASVSEGGPTATEEVMGRIQILRAKMIPETDPRWDGFTREVWAAWQSWKEESGYLDFTDMIETCLRDHVPPAGGPRVGFLDEVQDFTPLELALVRQWCAGMDHYVLAGDDDQTLFSFKGSTPDAWLFPELPDDQVRVLGQSYRVPAAVHAFAQRLVRHIRTRKAKDYSPTAERGAVSYCPGTWKHPSPVVREIDAQTSLGKTCMVLASCAYMIGPLLKELRDASIPFFNPYRRARGDWNPLARGGERKQTAVDRLFAFLATDPEAVPRPTETWTWGEVSAWAEPLRSEGLFRTGFKAALKERDLRAPAELGELAEWMDTEALERACEHDLEWLRASLLPLKSKPFAHAIGVALRRGKRSLIEPPRDRRQWALGTRPWCCVGTVHSVKGGEADCVWIFPDLSQRGWRQWLCGGEDGRDSTLRQFYVAATRAREILTLCAPDGRMSFPFSLGYGT